MIGSMSVNGRCQEHLSDGGRARGRVKLSAWLLGAAWRTAPADLVVNNLGQAASSRVNDCNWTGQYEPAALNTRALSALLSSHTWSNSNGNDGPSLLRLAYAHCS